MHFGQLIVRNALRSPVRGTMTTLAVAITLVAFVLMRAVSSNWDEQVRQTPNDRVVVRHRISFGHPMPVRYAQQVGELPGVKQAVAARYAGLKLPGDRPIFFESFAVDAKPFLEVHDELVVPEERKQAFLENRRGALVSVALASELGWKLGDTVILDSSEFTGQWTIQVEGIYESKRHGFAHRTIWFHWDYFNETLPYEDRDKISMIATQIDDPNQGAAIAKAIDIHFDDLEPATFSQEDRALNARLVGHFAAILDALNVLSLLILGVVLLILGNTVAMAVAERTKEYGTLRAIGFSPRHLTVLVLGEAGVLGVVGGVLGLLLSHLVVRNSLSRFFEEQMNMSPLQVSSAVGLTCLVVGGSLGLLSAAPAARRISRIQMIEALRHIA